MGRYLANDPIVRDMAQCGNEDSISLDIVQVSQWAGRVRLTEDTPDGRASHLKNRFFSFPNVFGPWFVSTPHRACAKRGCGEVELCMGWWEPKARTTHDFGNRIEQVQLLPAPRRVI